MIVRDLYILHSSNSQLHFVPVRPCVECGEVIFHRKIYQTNMITGFTKIIYTFVCLSLELQQVSFDPEFILGLMEGLSVLNPFQLASRFIS